MQEWHSSKLPITEVAKPSQKRLLGTRRFWFQRQGKNSGVCLKGHLDFMATCANKFNKNTGCPFCGDYVSPGRRSTLCCPLVGWIWQGRNVKRPSEVTLGSKHEAWWSCGQDSNHPAPDKHQSRIEL